MKTYIERTKYFAESTLDINPLKLQRYKNPLIVVARDAQKVRINKWYLQNLDLVEGKPSILGWWELSGSYLDKDHYPINEHWKTHDAIFFMDPERVHPPARKAYHGLINAIQGL